MRSGPQRREGTCPIFLLVREVSRAEVDRMLGRFFIQETSR